MKITPRAARLYGAGAMLLALAVLVFAQQAFNLTPLVSPSEPDQIFLVYALSTTIFIVLLIFGFVLSRTIVKVWLERKRHKPGAKFKTSLIVTMIALTLVPATVSFLFGFGLINRSISRWFNAPVDELSRATNTISAQWSADREREARSVLSYLAVQPAADLDQARTLFGLDALLVMDASGRIEQASSEGAYLGIAGKVVKELGSAPEVYIRDGAWLAGARRIDSKPEGKILVGVFPIPEQVAAATRAIADARSDYDRLVRDQKTARFTYVSILLLISVLTLFAAVWVGLTLSKRVTVPIESLAEATREISAGNLDHRVQVEAGEELGMLVTLFNDMAARLSATTHELEARRSYIEAILESIPTGVISLDADLSVNTLNRAARTMFSIGEMAQLDGIFTGIDLEAIRSLMTDATRANGNPVTRQLAFVAPGRPSESAVTATHLAGGGFVLVVEDLTELARAEKATAWREVARRLAHEIKNPLTPIQLSAERIARSVSRLPAAAPRVSMLIGECVGAIVGEVSSLKRLVDEFVRFARLPAVERSPSSMRDLVEKTLTLYEGRMDGIDVEVDIAADLPPVLMDAPQMKGVLVNLIDNAVEALRDQPVKAIRIQCELVREGAMSRLTVEDTGCGIRPEDRERLFTPYFTTRGNGTGLGLAIAGRIVADHGGYIGAVPLEGRGTRFVIELPVCPESSLSMTSPASASS